MCENTNNGRLRCINGRLRYIVIDLDAMNKTNLDLRNYIYIYILYSYRDRKKTRRLSRIKKPLDVIQRSKHKT